jgi:8-oxo-dGTP diphosphatase
MKERHTVIPRTMCFVFYGDEVLIMKASEKKDWAGIYNPLGGHIEKGEDILQNAEREILEESGLTVHDTKLCGILHVTNFYGKNIMMFITTSKSDSKKVISSDEGTLEWIRVSEIDAINSHTDLKPILERVLSSTGVFTGVSEFDDNNQLLKLDFYPRTDK